MRAAGWGRALLLVLAGVALLHLARLLALSVTAAGVRRHHLESAWYVVALVAVGLALARRDEPAAPAAPASAPRSRRDLLGVAAAAIAASALLYGATLWLGLLSDDYVLVGMPVLPGPHWEHVRPLPLLVWRGVGAIAGAPGLHGLNVLLHGVNAAGVHLLTQRLAPDAPRAVAGLAAAIFLTSPIAVEPIAWAAGVFDTGLVTAGLGYLLALTSPASPSRMLPVAFGCLAAALATKETAVGLPLIAALVGLRLRLSRIAVLASAALAGAYAIVRLHGAEVPVGESSTRYLVKEIVSRAFAAVGQPWTSADVNAVPLLLGLAVPFGYALLIVASMASRGGWRRLSTAAWVVAGAAPVLGFFYVDPALSGSRYAYLPLAGWAIFLAESAWRQGSDLARRAAVGFVLAVVAAGVIGGQRRLAAWREAAAMRDRVIAEGRRTLQASACPEVALLAPPDMVDGVFVFRNGLPEALREPAGPRVTTRADAGVPLACTWTWRADRFVAAAPAAAP